MGRAEPSRVAPRAPFGVYLSLHGADAIFSSEAQRRLTGRRLFMPFALIMWAGLSAGGKQPPSPKWLNDTVEFIDGKDYTLARRVASRQVL